VQQAQPAVTDISYEGLLDNVPLTPEKLRNSNDSIEHALFQVGVNLQNGLEEYGAAIDNYEKLLEQFPATTHREETLFNLYYCYQKTGNESKMASTRQLLQTQYVSGKYFRLLENKGKNDTPESARKAEANKTYDDIYSLFIEGKFEEAIAMKKKADSLHGQSFWTPQLLYIEAVYHIRQREDSIAKLGLQKIIQLYPSSPITKKSQNLLSVLNRRKEIEDYLTKLEIQRPTEDSMVVVNDKPITAPQQPVVVQKTDSLVAKKDSTLVKNQPAKKPEPVVNPKVDSSALIKTVKPVAVSSIYANTPDQKQYVGLVLDKVDPVYANEAKNAFNRYHREKYYNKTFEIATVAVSDTLKIILFKDFANAAEAIDYIDRTKKLASVEIIPWLTESKYSFILITEKNMGILTDKKDISTYRKFLHDAYPGKF
jgi:tetratricopeptide (TPR) repeat protein